MIIKKSDSVEKLHGDMKIRVFKTGNPELSLAKIELKGRHGKIKNKVSTTTYYILRGEAEFIIKGSTEKASEGDVVVVPKNTPYDIKGNSVYLVFHSPAYNPRDEKNLEAENG
jgi:mannose-6-phosphate isomerase-like protein (cupin superfamily)